MIQNIISKFDKPALAYLSVVGGFLVQLTLGSIYTYGNMFPFMLDYMYNHTSPKMNITAGNAMWIFGLTVFGLGSTMSLGGIMIKKIGTIPTILSGSWLMSLGVLVTYWTINTHLVLVAITYGLLLGLGIGIAYGTIISIPSEWFPDSKGLVTGIVVAGFGFSPITLDFIQSAYINPNFTNKNTENVDRVPSSFLVMGTIYAIFQLIGSVMIRRPNTIKVKQIDNENNVNTNIFSSLQNPEKEIRTKPLEMIFEKDFWILWLSYTLNTCVAVLILSLHKMFGRNLQISELLLTTSTALGAAFNGIGRIIWGYFIDRFTYKRIMTILTVWMSAMIGTFYTCSLLTKDISICIMYFIWVIILHFLLSGNFSIFPVVCTRRFGMENGVVNYGVLFTAYALGGIIVSTTTTTMIDDKGGLKVYLAPFLVGCGLSILSAIITQMYHGKLFRNSIAVD